MNGQVHGSWVGRCRQLKKDGMTVRGISEKLHLSRATVGRYVKGMADQREIRDIQTRTVCPINPNNEVGNTGHTDQDSMSHMSHKSQGVVTKTDQDSMSRMSHMSHKSQGVVTNADQDSMSHMSQRRGKSNIGVSVLLFLGLTILILILVDRFILEGKILAWVFGQLKLEGQSQPTEEKVQSRGFGGRSLDEV